MNEVHPEFDRLLRAARRAPPGAVLVLGSVDSGKTTVAQNLAAALAEGGPVHAADADMGQSWLGPPTTMGRAAVRRPRRDWSRVQPERLFFVGGTSPAVNPELCIASLVRLVTEDVPPDARMIVDTPGLAIGPLAEAFWKRVAARLRPAALVAIQREAELEPVLWPFRDAGTAVVAVAPGPHARRRDAEERAIYRQAAYARYFRPGHVRYADRARLRVAPAAPYINGSLAHGRLVGVASGGRDLGLGVVQAVGPSRVGLVTPLVSLQEVDALVVSGLCVDPVTGRETRI